MVFVHLFSLKTMYVCEKCEKTFDKEKKYKNHLLRNICKKKEIFTCILCNYITKIKCNYLKHLETKKCKEKTKELQKNKIYECTTCKKSFRDNCDLLRHTRRKNTCVSSSTIIHSNNINNSNNTIQQNINNGIIINTHDSTIINAHDPSAFIKDLNIIDKRIYNNMLQSYSINSPESIKRLSNIASATQYRTPKLINPDDYPSDEEEDIENANHERLKDENTKYVSNVFCQAFFDTENLEFAPFFKSPSSKKIKVKYDNHLHELDMHIVFSLIDTFMHKMQIIQKEKNICIDRVHQEIQKAYNTFRYDFIDLIKKYRYEQKKISK